MNETLIIDSDKIHLREVNILNGHFNHDGNLEVNQVEGFEFTFSLQIGLDEEAKSIKITLGIEIIGRDTEKNELPIKVGYTADFIFFIENIDEFLIKEGNNVQVHGLLSATLNGISYSTMRGIVLTRTQGSLLKNGILLPVINPSNLSES